MIVKIEVYSSARSVSMDPSDLMGDIGRIANPDLEAAFSYSADSLDDFKSKIREVLETNKKPWVESAADVCKIGCNRDVFTYYAISPEDGDWPSEYRKFLDSLSQDHPRD